MDIAYQINLTRLFKHQSIPFVGPRVPSIPLVLSIFSYLTSWLWFTIGPTVTDHYISLISCSAAGCRGFWLSKFLARKFNLVGGFNPSEKYARQIGSFPQVGMKKENIWSHHLINSLASLLESQGWLEISKTFSWLLFGSFQEPVAVKFPECEQNLLAVLLEESVCACKS